MFLNSLSITLTLVSLIALLLLILAGRIGYRVIRYWDPARDDARQISLEGEIVLSSTLVQYGLASQIITLVLFVFAADAFCQVITGAMCATGSLLANPYGMPSLLLKLAAVFFYGAWISMHRLDLSCETYPLVRKKYIFLFALIPLLAADITLQTVYIANLSPDIITSCCAVVFGAVQGGDSNLLAGFSRGKTLGVFYGLFVLLFAGSVVFLRRGGGKFVYLYALLWLLFLVVALFAITTVFSSYIYAMPFHKCPFCIIKPEYHYIGLVIYGTLLCGTFFGINSGIMEFFVRNHQLQAGSHAFQRKSLLTAVVMLTVFGLLVSSHYVLYNLLGGEF